MVHGERGAQTALAPRLAWQRRPHRRSLVRGDTRQVEQLRITRGLRTTLTTGVILDHNQGQLVADPRNLQLIQQV